MKISDIAKIKIKPINLILCLVYCGAAFKVLLTLTRALGAWGIIVSLFSVVGLSAGALIILLPVFGFKPETKRETINSLATAAILSAYVSILVIALIYPLTGNRERGKLYSFEFLVDLITNTLTWYPFIFLCSRSGKGFDVALLSRKRILTALLPTGVLFFSFFVFLPSDSFFANPMDFDFPFQLFIGWNILFMFGAAAFFALIIAIAAENLHRVLYALFMGLSLCVYVQYMFMNGNLQQIDGETMNWNEHIPFAVITGVIWIAIPVVFVIAAFKWEKIWEKLHIFLPAVLGAVQLVALVIMIFTADKSAFIYKANYMSSEEQFTVSQKDNIVVFVLDAGDNKYLKEIAANNPEEFDDYHDFTMFTNTCSLFDSTPVSIANMFAGMGFEVELSGAEWYKAAWSSERAKEFFSRFHEAGYLINGYSIQSDSDSHYLGLFDNCKTRVASEKIKADMVDTQKLNANFFKLSLYRSLPFALKRFAGSENISFYNVINYGKAPVVYDNYEFEKKLSLVLSESDKNYFITQHLNGTHWPCEDPIAETKHLLRIVTKYLNQMKEFGLYDNSTIIVTSDHGKHDSKTLPFASTPFFMVKRKGESKDAMTFNGAPVHHNDFQATLLDLAGLYDKSTDEDMFGLSVFDIPEDAVRTREWYDRRKDNGYPKVPCPLPGLKTKNNVYYGYEFTGDTAVFEEIVESGKYTVYPMVDYKG